MNSIKEPLKLGGILGAIALVLAILLSYVNSITAEKIDAVNAQAVQDGLREVMPEAKQFVLMDGSVNDNSYGIEVSDVYIAMDNDEHVIGYCATALPNGYGGKVETIVGMNMDAVITGVKVTNNMSETPGLGAKATKKENYTYQFEGKTAPLAVKKDGGEIDAIASATITSRAVVSGVNAAVEVMKANNIFGSYIDSNEIIDGKYVMPAEKPEPEQPEEGEEATEAAENAETGEQTEEQTEVRENE